MKMKKLLAICLIAGMAVSTTGCKTGGKAEKEGAAENQTAETQEASDTAEGGGGAESDEIQTVRLGVFTGGIDQYLAVVGQNQGIFEKHGIQLEITEFAAGINTVDAIVTGQSDIGMIADFAGVNRIGNTKENCNIRIIGRYTSATSYDLYVNPEEVTDISDLAGKGFATAQGTILEYYTALTYDEAGIPKEDRVTLNVDSGQTALSLLASGDAVAYWCTGAAAEKVEEQGMKKLLSMEDLGLSVDAYYVSSEEFIAEKPETVENFLDAVAETEEWVLSNTEEAAEIAEDKIGVPENQFMEDVEDSELILDFKKDSVDHLNRIKNWEVEEGIFESDFEITDFVDTTALEKLFPENVDY